MPAKSEREAIEVFGLWFLCMLPLGGLISVFVPKVRRTWKGKSVRPK